MTTSPVTTNPGSTSPATTSPVTTTPVAVWPPEPEIPPQLEGFDVAPITIGGRPLWVAVADTSTLRSRGLMNVTDLGDVDGMLFVFDAPVQSGFWMKDTPMPLDIAFFAADGSLVDVLQMEPCLGDQTCPVYKPGGFYQLTVEMPQGELVGLDPAARLDVNP